MDTSAYRDASKKYLPCSIRFLFVPESPRAFRDEQKMTFFYFAKSYGDLFFSNMMKAIFHVDYKKSPEKKRALLRRFQTEQQCYLINAVQYPINRDRKGQRIDDKKKIGYIQKEMGCFLFLVHDLKGKGHR